MSADSSQLKYFYFIVGRGRSSPPMLLNIPEKKLFQENKNTLYIDPLIEANADIVQKVEDVDYTNILRINNVDADTLLIFIHDWSATDLWGFSNHITKKLNQNYKILIPLNKGSLNSVENMITTWKNSIDPNLTDMYDVKYVTGEYPLFDYLVWWQPRNCPLVKAEQYVKKDKYVEITVTCRNIKLSNV